MKLTLDLVPLCTKLRCCCLLMQNLIFSLTVFRAKVMVISGCNGHWLAGYSLCDRFSIFKTARETITTIGKLIEEKHYNWVPLEGTPSVVSYTAMEHPLAFKVINSATVRMRWFSTLKYHFLQFHIPSFGQESGCNRKNLTSALNVFNNSLFIEVSHTMIQM